MQNFQEIYEFHHNKRAWEMPTHSSSQFWLYSAVNLDTWLDCRKNCPIRLRLQKTLNHAGKSFQDLLEGEWNHRSIRNIPSHKIVYNVASQTLYLPHFIMKWSTNWTKVWNGLIAKWKSQTKIKFQCIALGFLSTTLRQQLSSKYS